MCVGGGGGPENFVLVINVFHKVPYELHQEEIGPDGSSCFCRGEGVCTRIFKETYSNSTLVNVNAPVVATTSWWLHFSAQVVA